MLFADTEVCFPSVDVRDVAEAHIRGMESATAVGKRFLLVAVRVTAVTAPRPCMSQPPTRACHSHPSMHVTATHPPILVSHHSGAWSPPPASAPATRVTAVTAGHSPLRVTRLFHATHSSLASSCCLAPQESVDYPSFCRHIAPYLRPLGYKVTACTHSLPPHPPRSQPTTDDANHLTVLLVVVVCVVMYVLRSARRACPTWWPWPSRPSSPRSQDCKPLSHYTLGPHLCIGLSHGCRLVLVSMSADPRHCHPSIRD